MKRALLLVSLAVACAEETPATRPPLVVGGASSNAGAVPPPPPARDDGRLPAVAKPIRYALDLDVDPRKDTFSGSERILLDVLEDTAHVVLNARDIHIKRAWISTQHESIEMTANMRTAHGALEADELVLSADRIVPKGRATLSIQYDAPFGKQLSGLYVASDAGEKYAFTQFEATDARRAFPCFDEPGFKTPYDVTLTVPSGMIALSNGRQTSEQAHGDKTTFVFGVTPPLPTYLVAFAAGHFDVVEGPKTPVPIRFITTKGRSVHAAPALKAGAEILPILARYFGIAYPYEKLDLVAVPDFGAGGMENAGFITFRDDAVLLEERASARQRRGLIGLMTHELAHQWFGDLVTMKWWDDLWLNEGFATWTTFKIVDQYKPELGYKADAAANATYIMDQDGLATARAIRQPVTSIGQAMEAFDGITYQKGAAVLRMIEHHVGEDSFRRGVHAYLTKNAWGNATADDLLAEIGAKDIAREYLDQPGVPVVVVDSFECGKTAKGHQDRYAPLGVTFESKESTAWNVPLCLEPKGGKDACAMTKSSWTLPVPGACPVFGNPDAIGYYRVAWPEKDIGAIMRGWDTASASTRVAALADAWAQARMGKLDGGVLLKDVLPAVDRETDRHVIERLSSILYDLADIVDEATWPAFAAYVRARVAPHLARLDRIGEGKLDEDQRLLRRSLTYAAVDLGDDAALAKKLEAVAKAFRAGDKSVDADYGQGALELTARTADPAELRKAVEAATTPQAHAIALRAASGVTDPAAVRAQLDWMLSPAVKLQDVGRIMWPLANRHRSRATTLAYVRDHWDAFRAKLPGHLSRSLVSLAGYACTQPELDAARAFYTQKATTLEGADRPLSQALESATSCVALRGKLLPQMKTALSSSGAADPARR
jgi:alanyl aminopeptidase